jgi:hypothetical protein
MRKKLSAKEEKEILLKSARRCSLCFGLHRDFSVKKGQIAHIDRDSNNSKPENLVYLCLNHHNDYDSKSKQSKGFTTLEILTYRSSLYDKVHRELKEDEIYKEELDLETLKSDEVISVIGRYESISINGKSSIVVKEEVIGRLHKICECSNRMSEIRDDLKMRNLSEEKLGERCYEAERQLMKSFGIPPNIWSISNVVDLEPDWLLSVDDLIGRWSQGICSYNDCTDLLFALDEEYDLDYTYILYGLPIQDLDRIANAALLNFTYKFGMRATDSRLSGIELKSDSNDINF